MRLGSLSTSRVGRCSGEVGCQLREPRSAGADASADFLDGCDSSTGIWIPHTDMDDHMNTPAEADKLFTYAFPGTDQVWAFATYEELRAAISQEREAWNWLAQKMANPGGAANYRTGTSQDFQLASSIRSRVIHDFNDLDQAFSRFKENRGRYQEVTNALNILYGRRELPLSTSAKYAFISAVAQDAPLEAAVLLVHCVNFTSNELDLTLTPLLATTSVRAALFAAGYGGTEKALVTALNGTLASLQSAANSGKSEANDLIVSLKAANAEHLAAFTRMATDLETKSTEQKAALTKLQQELEAKRVAMEGENKTFNDNLRSVYAEHMKLKAPVEYWTDKAKAHDKAANRNCLAWLVGVLLYGGLAWLLATSVSQLEGSAFYKTVGLIAFLALPVIWYQRIIARLWLSNRHLSQDANERVAMCKAYLALATDKEGGKGLIEQERVIVMNALFRPSKVGVLRDDAMPSTPTNLFSKGLTGP